MANSCGARIMNFKGGDAGAAAAGFRSIGGNVSTLMGGRRRKSRSARKPSRKSKKSKKSKKTRKTRKSRKSRKSRK